MPRRATSFQVLCDNSHDWVKESEALADANTWPSDGMMAIHVKLWLLVRQLCEVIGFNPSDLVEISVSLVNDGMLVLPKDIELPVELEAALGEAVATIGSDATRRVCESKVFWARRAIQTAVAITRNLHAVAAASKVTRQRGPKAGFDGKAAKAVREPPTAAPKVTKRSYEDHPGSGADPIIITQIFCDEVALDIADLEDNGLSSNVPVSYRGAKTNALQPDPTITDKPRADSTTYSEAVYPDNQSVLNQKAGSTALASGDKSGAAELRLSIRRDITERVASDIGTASPSIVGPGSDDALACRLNSVPEREAPSAGDSGNQEPRNLPSNASAPSTLTVAISAGQQALTALVDAPGVSPAAPEAVKLQSVLGAGSGRILFDPPPGHGLTRAFEGVNFVYDHRLDAWMDETEAQHRARVDRALQPILNASMPNATEPWHAYLNVPASLDISRLIITAVLGSYVQVAGRIVEKKQFEVVPAAPVERIDLRRMLEKSIPILWDETPWSIKVMAKSPSQATQVGINLWDNIKGDHCVFDETRATWIERVKHMETTKPDYDDCDYESECTIDSETGYPRSRFAEVAAAINAKSLPHPQKKAAEWSEFRKAPSPLRTECSSVLLLGIGGSGKTHLMKSHLQWMQERYVNTEIFHFNASRSGLENKGFKDIVRKMAIAEAEGKLCVFVCDEVQHLSADDLERLGVCAAVVLAGDVRQSGSLGRVHPVITFVRQIKADVIDMTRVWRASNISLLNQISYTFYDSAFSALGRGDGIQSSIFKFDTCSDDAEVIASRYWAAATTLRSLDRSLMLVIERDEIRDLVLQMAGSDKRQWKKGAGTIHIVKPSQIQGGEADVVMFLPSEFIGSQEDVASTIRRFLTLMGRARQEIWALFTQASAPTTVPGRVFASLLRSYLETKVVMAAYSTEKKLETWQKTFLQGLQLTAHQVGTWTHLAYRDRPVALFTGFYHGHPRGIDLDLKAFAQLQGWLLLAVFIYTDGSMKLAAHEGSDDISDALTQIKNRIDSMIERALI